VLKPGRAPKLDPGLAEARFAMAEIINVIEKGATVEELAGALRELGRGCFMLVAGRSEDRFCSKCQARINAWDLLPLVGYQLDEDRVLELRNCRHCGSTLSAEVPEHERADARLKALEGYLRQGETIDRVVELASIGGRLVINARHRHGTDRTLTGVETLGFGLQTLLGGR